MTSGCSTLQAIMEPPKVVIKSVDVSNVGIKGIDLNVNLQIENPNETTLTIDQFKYDLSIGDSSLINGLFKKSVDLKGKQTSLISVPVHLSYENSKTAVENYLFKSIRTYKLTGFLTSGLITVPLTDEGKIEFKR